MRLVLAFSLLGLLAACAGDSSSVMSAWNDDDTGGAGGSAGGRGGSAAGGQSGSAGKGGSGGSGGVATTLPTGGTAGNIVVPGGARDAITAQCVSTSSGGGCPVDATSLQCWKGPCGSYVSACFQGTSGPCAAYAACLFNCPCNGSRSNCELACLSDKGMGDEKCSPFVNDLGVCLSANSCIRMACLVN